MDGNALRQIHKESQHPTPYSVYCVHFDAAADANESVESRTVIGQIAPRHREPPGPQSARDSLTSRREQAFWRDLYSWPSTRPAALQ